MGSEGASSSAVSPEQSELTLAWLKENWVRLLHAIRPRNRAVEALLKSCEPLSVHGDVVTLGFYFPFHKEKMDDEQHRQVVEEALAEVSGRVCRVQCTLCTGDRSQKERDGEAVRREKLLDNPVVNEAIKRYGARVVDIQ